MINHRGDRGQQEDFLTNVPKTLSLNISKLMISISKLCPVIVHIFNFHVIYFLYFLFSLQILAFLLSNNNLLSFELINSVVYPSPFIPHLISTIGGRGIIWWWKSQLVYLVKISTLLFIIIHFWGHFHVKDTNNF